MENENQADAAMVEALQECYPTEETPAPAPTPLPDWMSEAVDGVEHEMEVAGGGLPPVTDEDLDRLHRYVRVRLRLEEERARVRKQAEAMVRAIDQKLQGLEYVHGVAVSEYAKRLIAEQNRGKKRPTKSVKLLVGTVGFRSVKSRLEIVRPEELLEAATPGSVLEECVKVTRTPQVGLVEAFIAKHGELPPGCDYSEAREEFYLRAPKSKDGDEE